MLNFLMNPWILLLILAPVMLLVGILAGNFSSQPRKNRVIKLAPESHIGIELEVKSEDAVNIYCDPVGKTPPQRFIKILNPYNIAKKGFLKIYNYALWFGRYGTAYVHKFGDEDVHITLKQAISNVFGEKYFKQIPEAVMTVIEKGKLGVVVQFPKDPLTPTDDKGEPLRSISEDDLNRDADSKAMGNLWNEYEKEKKGQMMNTIMVLGTGIAIGFVIMLITKWGSPVVIPPVVIPA